MWGRSWHLVELGQCGTALRTVWGPLWGVLGQLRWGGEGAEGNFRQKTRSGNFNLVWVYSKINVAVKAWCLLELEECPKRTVGAQKELVAAMCSWHFQGSVVVTGSWIGYCPAVGRKSPGCLGLVPPPFLDKESIAEGGKRHWSKPQVRNSAAVMG